MKDNLFLIMFCVFFIVLDTLVLGYSIGRIYPPISKQVSTHSTVSSIRKEKQEQKSEEQEEIIKENQQQQEDLPQEQNLSASEQQQELDITQQRQNLQKEQRTATITQDENTINTIIESEIPYTYTREEINAMLVIDGNLFLESDNFEGKEDTDTVTDTDVIINGETYYMGVAFTGVSWNELMPYDDRAGFFVGNQSLKVYNERKEYIGMATENFLPALAKENQGHLEQ